MARTVHHDAKRRLSRFRKAGLAVGIPMLALSVVNGVNDASAASNGSQINVNMDLPAGFATHKVVVEGTNNYDKHSTHSFSYAGDDHWELKEHWFKGTITVIATYTRDTGHQKVAVGCYYVHKADYDVVFVRWTGTIKDGNGELEPGETKTCTDEDTRQLQGI